MCRVLIATVLALLAGTAQARADGPAAAPLSETVTFVNATPVRVLHVYIWRHGDQPWLEDALGQQFIEPGAEARIQAVEGPGCVYDYEVEFVDQHKAAGSVNVCRDPVVRLEP